MKKVSPQKSTSTASDIKPAVAPIVNDPRALYPWEKFVTEGDHLMSMLAKIRAAALSMWSVGRPDDLHDGTAIHDEHLRELHELVSKAEFCADNVAFCAREHLTFEAAHPECFIPTTSPRKVAS